MITKGIDRSQLNRLLWNAYGLLWWLRWPIAVLVVALITIFIIKAVLK